VNPLRDHRAPACGVLAVALLLATAAVAEALMVSAAASLREAIDGIATSFARETGIAVHRNFGGSGVLARQIEEGAPVDVLLSAGWPEVRRLQRRRLVAAPVVVARNRLVVIVPEGSPWTDRPVRDLFVSPEVTRIAIGDPDGVPFGHYARAALRRAGLWDGLAGRLVFAADVRQALTYAEHGAVDAAIVYATDARLLVRAAEVGEVPGAASLRIEALAVRIAASRDPAADRFLAYLTTEPAARVFADHGFLPPRP
jgi:molybdate transport system substrate-binding protein